jgi:hypothetical protein
LITLFSFTPSGTIAAQIHFIMLFSLICVLITVRNYRGKTVVIRSGMLDVIQWRRGTFICLHKELETKPYQNQEVHNDVAFFKSAAVSRSDNNTSINHDFLKFISYFLVSGNSNDAQKKSPQKRNSNGASFSIYLFVSCKSIGVHLRVLAVDNVVFFFRF